jgi:lysophospholipid acyltransferase (LPLAT)-like uncharacterized protein
MSASERQIGHANAKRACSRLDRLKFRLVAWLGSWIIRAIGGTLRWHVEGWENHESIRAAGRRIIYTFWHGMIFPGAFFFRNRGIVVMTSQNRDGEYIAGVIQRLGYGAARGSSTRGSRGALAEMIRDLRAQKDVAFSIDGPTGPRYVAKPGAAWIASRTGAAVLPFYITSKRKWVFNSWDHFQIPMPFSRAVALIGVPIYVGADAGAKLLEEAQRELQSSLERLLQRGESYWRKDTGE